MDEKEIRIPGSKTLVRCDPEGHWYTVSPATLLIIQARKAETDDEFKATLLKAVQADPHSVLAHWFLAQHCSHYGSIAEEVFHLGNAIAAGDIIWQHVADQLGQEMRWWEMHATRPYMEAIKRFGVLQSYFQEWDVARVCFTRLLEMNPADDQDIHAQMHHMEMLIKAQENREATAARWRGPGR